MTAPEVTAPGQAAEPDPRDIVFNMLWHHRRALGDDRTAILDAIDAYADDARNEGCKDAQAAVTAAAAAQGASGPHFHTADIECADCSVERELAALREDLAAHQEEISRWPRCPSGCKCRVGTDDADALDCACDGPCCTGWEQPAPAAAPEPFPGDLAQLLAQPPEETGLRDGVTRLAVRLAKSADATRPSKKSAIEDEIVASLFALLEQP